MSEGRSRKGRPSILRRWKVVVRRTGLPEVEQSEELKVTTEALLQPKHGVPASCFAYVGHAGEPRTRKLPYCQADGTVDTARLQSRDSAASLT